MGDTAPSTPPLPLESPRQPSPSSSSWGHISPVSPVQLSAPYHLTWPHWHRVQTGMSSFWRCILSCRPGSRLSCFSSWFPGHLPHTPHPFSCLTSLAQAWGLFSWWCHPVHGFKDCPPLSQSLQASINSPDLPLNVHALVPSIRWLSNWHPKCTMSKDKCPTFQTSSQKMTALPFCSSGGYLWPLSSHTPDSIPMSERLLLSNYAQNSALSLSPWIVATAPSCASCFAPPHTPHHQLIRNIKPRISTLKHKRGDMSLALTSLTTSHYTQGKARVQWGAAPHPRSHAPRPPRCSSLCQECASSRFPPSCTSCFTLSSTLSYSLTLTVFIIFRLTTISSLHFLALIWILGHLKLLLVVASGHVLKVWAAVLNANIGIKILNCVHQWTR